MPLAEFPAFTEPPARPRCEPGTVDLWLVDLGSVPRRGLSAAAREALLEVLGRYLGLEPGEVELATRPDGKPELTGAAAGRVRFNLSHSGEVALIAVGSDEVGVDVERIDPSRNLEGVARRTFGREAAEELARVPLPARAAAFYARWTAHEARVKLSGEGFAGMRQAPSRSVTVRPVPVGEGYAAAVAVHGVRWTVRRWAFRPA
jgi:4'-phosphopantetheinyl transferase